MTSTRAPIPSRLLRVPWRSSRSQLPWPLAAVLEQRRRAAVGGQHHVQVAVAVQVAVGGAAGDPRRRGQVRDRVAGDLHEAPLARVVEELRRLGVAHPRLDPLDLRVEVAVGQEEVEPAVQVVVEVEGAEGQGEQGLAAEVGDRGDVDEELVALVPVERHHLVGEVADDDRRAAAAVVVGGVDPHAAAGDAGLGERHAGGDADLLEGAVALVAVEEVRLRVVGHRQVLPAVAVQVEHRDAERLGGRLVEAGLLGGVLEACRPALVAVEAGRGAGVGLRRAVGLGLAVQGAEEVVVRRPGDVAGGVDVEAGRRGRRRASPPRRRTRSRG